MINQKIKRSEDRMPWRLDNLELSYVCSWHTYSTVFLQNSVIWMCLEKLNSHHTGQKFRKRSDWGKERESMSTIKYNGIHVSLHRGSQTVEKAQPLQSNFRNQKVQGSKQGALRTRWRHQMSCQWCHKRSECPSRPCPAGPRWSRHPWCGRCTCDERWAGR